MSFEDLAKLPLADFIEAHRGNDKTFWLFQHIPKTAGSSFSRELSERKAPYHNICVDYSDDTRLFRDKIVSSVDDFLKMAQEQPYRSASGHLKQHLVARLVEAHDDCRVVTFLRGPEARVISDYRYQRTPSHPPHEAFIEQFPTLESYVLAPSSQNTMADFLLGSLDGVTPEDAVARIGKSHVFIGLLELYPMSFNIMFRLMGHDGLWPTEHQNKTPDDATTKVEVTPELRAMIRETNRLDQAIYDYTRAVLVQHRDAFQKLAVQHQA